MGTNSDNPLYKSDLSLNSKNMAKQQRKSLPKMWYPNNEIQQHDEEGKWVPWTQKEPEARTEVHRESKEKP